MEVKFGEGAFGTFTDWVTIHPLESVIVQLQVFDERPVAIAVVCIDGVFQL
jgi:hypothetical protein